MGMTYHHAKLPDDRELVERVSAAAGRLFDKLAPLDADHIDVSHYNRRYLKRYQAKLHSNLQKFAYILMWALAGSKKPVGDTVLLDFGGGTGILSLLAMESHVGTVIYSDIYDVSCVDAQTIGVITRARADYYICGGVKEVANFLERESISCDALVSSDVIEHVYDMGELYTSIRELSTGFLSLAVASHANPLNPVVRRLLMKKQVQVEHLDREYEPGHKKRDNLRSYYSIRKYIVRACCRDALTEHEVERLARDTRGMVVSDIQASVLRYTRTKEMPVPIDHPTNTCDPYTGNWADRLLDPHEIRNGFARAGFRVDIRSGFYGRPNGLVKRVLARVLDTVISLLRRESLRLAPFFLIHGGGDMSRYRHSGAPLDRSAKTIDPNLETVDTPVPTGGN